MLLNLLPTGMAASTLYVATNLNCTMLPQESYSNFWRRWISALRQNGIHKSMLLLRRYSLFDARPFLSSSNRPFILILVPRLWFVCRFAWLPPINSLISRPVSCCFFFFGFFHTYLLTKKGH